MNTKRIHSLAEAKSLGLTQGFVSKAVDLTTKQIVGYAQGSTFDQEALDAIHLQISEYLLYINPDNPDEFVEFSVHGISLVSALIALGLGNEYEEEYGDYAGFLDQVRKNPECLRVDRVAYVTMESEQVCSSVNQIINEKRKSK
jgi:hypothetical protein